MKTDNISFLLSINEAFATVQKPEDLLKPIVSKVYKEYRSPVGAICLFENNRTHAIIVFFEVSQHKSAGDILRVSEDLFDRYRMDELPFKLSFSSRKIVRHKISTLLKYPAEDPRFLNYTRMLIKHKIDQVVQVPLRCSGEITGFLLFGVTEENPFDDKEKLEFILQFANLVSVGLKNFINYDELHKRELFQAALLRITNNLVGIKDRDSIFSQLAREFLEPSIGESFLNFAEARMVNFFSGDPLIIRLCNEKYEYIQYGSGSDLFSILESLGIKPATDTNAVDISHSELERLRGRSPMLDDICRENDIYRLYWLEYTTADGSRIDSLMGLKNTRVTPELELSFAASMIPQMTLVLKNYAAYEEIDSLKKQLEQENISLIDEISHPSSYQEIIGVSPIIQSVLYKIKQVALIDSTVLIQGETGTGKELVAHAIHNTSARQNKVMVKVNCASLPAQLIESELFGHEKGSFTGAVERRIGKFELANGGSIFLDEIGELPLELQAKLLRILQEKEFERIGGKQTIKADVRIIAATNRNLEEEVNLGKFRADLYYRLNVFPITVPPLRQRKEDIPLFIRHFAGKYAKSMGRTVKEISRQDMDILMNYDWPGNIRELEHLIERATIISTGPTLDFSDVKLMKAIKKNEDLSSFKPLVEMEKEYIISALRATNGKIMGENSASALLGINGKTLGSKMRKLGIKREIVINS